VGTGSLADDPSLPSPERVQMMAVYSPLDGDVEPETKSAGSGADGHQYESVPIALLEEAAFPSLSKAPVPLPAHSHSHSHSHSPSGYVALSGSQVTPVPDSLESPSKASEAVEGAGPSAEALVPPRKTTDDDEDCEVYQLVSSHSQAAIDATRLEMADSKHSDLEREQKIRAVGTKFLADALDAARELPGAVERSFSASDSQGTHIVGESSTLRIMDKAGGVAGGAKARCLARGLFLKTPNDSHGIYGSMVMAAKATKRDAAAARWVHALDSVHINAPITVCVDVAHKQRTGGPDGRMMTRVTRVQVMSLCPAGGRKSLRVGSSNGGITLHDDPSQASTVVRPLMKHFHLQSCE